MSPPPGVKLMSQITNTVQTKIKKALNVLKKGKHWPQGHKHFWETDFTVHHDQDWYVSVRMHSDRNVASECFGGRGLQTEYLGDGVMWVLLSGDEYCTNDILPALDWERLPGITREINQKPKYFSSKIMGGNSFVGGTFTENYGVSSMQLNHPSCYIKAKKSWFFFNLTF
jgi:chondroitin AC lyase